MKALIINGSVHKSGTTKRALDEVRGQLEKGGMECTVYDLAKETRGCMGCYSCKKNGKCIIDDDVNRLAQLFEEADALIIGSPVYYASPSGALLSLLDRLFLSSSFDKRMKVGATVVVARRGGLSASYDAINKYFGISGMPIATSSYWNQLHGTNASEAEDDLEGLATMRNLGKNIAFLVKSIALGKEKIGIPTQEPKVHTNFVR